jgi:hypothetical protein
MARLRSLRIGKFGVDYFLRWCSMPALTKLVIESSVPSSTLAVLAVLSELEHLELPVGWICDVETLRRAWTHKTDAARGAARALGRATRGCEPSEVPAGGEKIPNATRSAGPDLRRF